MGDRFYTQQKSFKPKRVLKKDIIVELDELLSVHVDGIDRLTIKALNDLIDAIKVVKK